MFKITPTSFPVDTAAYALGDCIGGKLTIANAARRNSGGGEIRSLKLVDQANQKKAISLVLFDSDPTNTTFTDNGALDVNDTDMSKSLGVIEIAAADYRSMSDNAIATLKNIGIGYVLDGSRTLYGALVAGEAITYIASTDLSLALFTNRD